MTDTTANEIPVRIMGTHHRPTGEFTGHAIAPNGAYVARVSGAFPIDAVKIAERKPANRPKSEAKHIAVLAHTEWFQLTAKTLGEARISTADTLGICMGRDDSRDANIDERIREVRRTENKAHKALASHGVGVGLLLTGSPPGHQFLWIALEAGGIVDRNGAGVVNRISGWGWVCYFGDKEARYGGISLG